VSYALESVEARVEDGVRPTMTHAGAVLRESVRDLRGMLTEIYPADLDIMGFAQAIDRLADPLRAQGVEVAVSVPEVLAVGPVRATLLYRVAREALANTLKHAAATSVTVRLRREGTDVVLVIADDGVGFDLAGVGSDRTADSPGSVGHL